MSDIQPVDQDSGGLMNIQSSSTFHWEIGRWDAKWNDQIKKILVLIMCLGTRETAAAT